MELPHAGINSARLGVCPNDDVAQLQLEALVHFYLLQNLQKRISLAINTTVVQSSTVMTYHLSISSTCRLVD